MESLTAEPESETPAIEAASPTHASILGGVAALLAVRLGISAFWLRMAFVVLALAGGLGILLYAGLWLSLVRGPRTGSRPARAAGCVLLVVSLVYLIGRDRHDLITGATGMIALLIGLGVALWQPALPAPAPAPSVATPSLPRREQRPRSVLGQAVLGLAVATAAVGALIDQANGGRLHPEQWLGIAAAVCGLGMVVATLWGRAKWLIVPTGFFVAMGYVGGAAAERGIGIQDAGDEYVTVFTTDRTTKVLFGDIDFSVFQQPPSPQTRSFNVLVGEVRIALDQAEEVSVDLRWNIEHGQATIDGVLQSQSGSVHIGPAGEADLTLTVDIWRGDLMLWNQESFVDGETPPPETFDMVTTPFTTFVPGGDDTTLVLDGVEATADGYFILGYGEATIDDHDRVTLGTSMIRTDGVVEILTAYGTYSLLPHSLLLTPNGEIVDLQSWRERLAPSMSTSTTTPDATTTTGG